MKLIKIIPESIKKNANAGETSTLVHSCETIEFCSDRELPEWLIDGVVIIISEEFSNSLDNTIMQIEGILTDRSLLDKMQELPGMSICISAEVKRIKHEPIPKYSYEYEDAELRCNTCDAMVKVSELHDDYSDYGYCMSVCPHCRSLDSMEEYQYQTLRDALNGKQ